MSFTTAGDLPLNASLSTKVLPPKETGSDAPRLSASDRAALLNLYNSAPCGMYQVDRDGFFVSVNDTLLGWLGYTRSHVVGRLCLADVLLNIKQEPGSALLAFLEDCTSVQNLELELVRRDGTTLHALMNAVPSFDADGVCRGSHGIVFDITTRKEAENALRESQEQLRIALLTGQMGIWDWDVHSGHVRWAGDSAVLHDLTPVPPEETCGGKTSKEYFATIYSGDRDDVVDRINQAVLQGGEYVTEYRVVDQDGTIRWISGRGWVVLDENGEPERIRGVAQDITLRKETEQKVAELATTDGLTGLKNHRAFQELLQRELIRARRYDHPVSLILLDVDHFKRYNDTYGHPEGDKVLKAVAQCLREQCRKSDHLSRYGGEEFALILPETDGVQAVQVAERICAALPQMPGLQRKVTASIGVACHATGVLSNDSPDEARMDLIVVADWAMYEAKRSGRNRVFSNF